MQRFFAELAPIENYWQTIPEIWIFEPRGQCCRMASPIAADAGIFGSRSGSIVHLVATRRCPRDRVSPASHALVGRGNASTFFVLPIGGTLIESVEGMRNFRADDAPSRRVHRTAL